MQYNITIQYFTYTLTDIWFLVKDGISKEEGQKNYYQKSSMRKLFSI